MLLVCGHLRPTKLTLPRSWPGSGASAEEKRLGRKKSPTFASALGLLGFVAADSGLVPRLCLGAVGEGKGRKESREGRK